MATRTTTAAHALDADSIVPPPEDGEAAWVLVAKSVDEATRGETLKINLDMQEFCDRAYVTITELRANRELYTKFKRLGAAGFFEFAVIERLYLNLPALWYARHMQQEEDATHRRRAPAELIARASERRARMFRIANYHLEHHSEEGALLREIKFSTDHQQLANDLVTLVKMFERHHEAIAADVHFKADDLAGARNDSQDIRRARGRTESSAITWSERCAVLWTRVQRDYVELRATGAWLLRDKPDDARRRFPPMFERASHRTKDAADSANDTAPANEAKPAEPVPAVGATPPVVSGTASASTTSHTKPVAADEAPKPRNAAKKKATKRTAKKKSAVARSRS
jgi:hypothetical protein